MKRVSRVRVLAKDSALSSKQHKPSLQSIRLSTAFACRHGVQHASGKWLLHSGKRSAIRHTGDAMA